MRGAFTTYKKTGEAKFRVKMKQANADMEVRGADPDYNTRGGRSAAMDPGTATEPGTDRAGGQKRQGRSRDDEDGRGAPVARGGAAASSTDWSTRGPGGGTGEGVEDRGDEASPADDHETTEPDLHVGQLPPTDPGASPPGLSNAAGTSGEPRRGFRNNDARPGRRGSTGEPLDTGRPQGPWGPGHWRS